MTLTATTQPVPDNGSRRHRRRIGLAVATAVALVGTGATISPQPASAATIDTGAYYVITSRHSGKALDVYNLATNDGAPIVQWTRNDGNQQQWQFVDAGSGYYKIKSRHSGKFLELPNANDGTQLVQNADNGTTRQHFQVADSDGGHVRFVNRHSGKALDIWEWSTADGGIISQFQDLGGWNQQWQLNRIGSGGGGTGCGSGSFNAEAVLNGSTWTARNGSSTVYTGTDMRSAMQAAVNSLSRVVPRSSGWSYAARVR